MKRILSVLLVLMTIMSTVAFAAEPATYEPAEDGTYSIGYTEGIASNYYSLVVIEGKYTADETPVISEESVLYIDQATADANGDVTFDGWIPKNDEKATVYLGGTGADKPVLLGYLAAASRTITGTVFEVPATANEATVTFTGVANTDTEGTEFTATADANGAYTIKVPEGSYKVKVEIDNYLSYEEDYTVNADAAYDNVTLLGGDVNADGAINDADITKLVNGGSYGADCDIDGDGTVDFDDLMVVLNNYGKTTASAEAKTAPEVVYTLSEVSSGTYKVVATLTDTEDDFRGWKNDIIYDSTVITPVADSFVAYNGATVVTKTITENGDESKIVFESYVTPGSKDATGIAVFEMQFTLASGKTTADFTSETFKIDYVAYANGEYNYYGAENAANDNITVINEVVPSAAIITVPVTAGDIVYLQDGTYAVAETTGDYQVLSKRGYVAVNTGKESQKTYYVDSLTAELVHVNGVVGSDDLSIRAIDANDVDENNKSRNGLRFKMLHNPTTREVGKGENPISDEKDVVTEVGFLMTVESKKVTGAIGEDPVLTMNMVDEVYKDSNGKPFNPVMKGVAYSTETGENKAFNTEDDDLWIISGVFYNIPIDTEKITAEQAEKNVTMDIISRPYYIVNGKVVYGEQTEATLYDVAKGIKDGAGFTDLEQYMQDYINDIVGLVSIDYTEDEIIINIEDLYTALAALEGEE